MNKRFQSRAVVLAVVASLGLGPLPMYAAEADATSQSNNQAAEPTTTQPATPSQDLTDGMVQAPDGNPAQDIEGNGGADGKQPEVNTGNEPGSGTEEDDPEDGNPSETPDATKPNTGTDADTSTDETADPEQKDGAGQLGEENPAADASDQETPQKNGIVLEEDGNRYCYRDGQKVTGEQLVDGNWYYFAPEQNGAMAHGLTSIPDNAKPNSKKLVYYDPVSGQMVHGERFIDGHWYLFDIYTGAMAHGVQPVKDAAAPNGIKWVYYDIATGQMRYGEQYLSYDRDHTGWYHFDEHTGAMSHGVTWAPSNGGKWVYYDIYTGQMRHGEQRLSYDKDHTGWYHFDEATGAMSHGMTYLKSNGGKWVYYDIYTGQMRYGRVIVDGVSRYFDPYTGACDKIGYQNPSQYYQVSTRNVSLPSYARGGIFSYVTPSRISIDATRQQCIDTMIARAYEYLGSPYVWDYSCAPGVGVDCAGLVMQALYATGMDLSPMNPWDHYYTPGHDAYANYMWSNGRFQHLSFSQRQRGDIVCYPGHVAIYLGNDTIIEAYSPKTGVRISSVYSSPNIRGVLRPFV